MPHGRVLGGSSALNGLAFVGTSKMNVDAWASLGNPGWDWHTMAPYYKKTYTLTLPSDVAQNHLGLDYVCEDTKSANGPIKLSFPEDIEDPLPKAWVETLNGLGFHVTGDPFTGEAYGAYTNAASIDHVTRQRSFSANAYYEPVSGRANLHVITSALVEKVILDGSSNEGVTARGVQYTKDGRTQVANARREVILSAGAFHSPKILELSGIGSPTILNAHNIPIMISNPNVGENLQDHVLGGLSFEVNDNIKTKDDLARQDPAALGAAMESYAKHQTGPFTVGGNFSSALLPVPHFLTQTGKLELEHLINSSQPPTPTPFDTAHATFVRTVLTSAHEGSGGFFTYPAQSNFNGSGPGAELVQTVLPENYLTIAVSLLHPLSRGSVHITSPDPTAPVAIDPRYLTHPLDLEVLTHHIRYIETIARSEPLSTLLKPNGKRNRGLPPGDLRDWPLDEVKKYVRRAALSTWHATSTCAMMPVAMAGVVDGRLKVHGTRNLRVVDASVIPISTRGNTQTSVYAIAERAADLVREDHGLRA